MPGKKPTDVGDVYDWSDLTFAAGVKLHADTYADDAGDDEAKGWTSLLTEGPEYSLYSGTERDAAAYTRDDFESMVANLKAYKAMFGHGPHLDANHANAWGFGGEDSKLRARIDDLRIVEGAKKGDPATLQMKPTWNERGRAELTAGDFDSISAETAEIQDKRSAKALGMAIVGASLCNNPYYSGLGTVTLSELARNRGSMTGPDGTSATREEGPMKDLIKKLSEVHGSDLTEDGAIEAYAAAKRDAAEVVTLRQQVKDLEEAKKTSGAELVELHNSVTDLQTRLGKADEERAIERDLADHFVSKAEAGTDAEPGKLRKLYRDHGPEAYAAVVDHRRSLGEKVTGRTRKHADPVEPDDGSGDEIQDILDAGKPLAAGKFLMAEVVKYRTANPDAKLDTFDVIRTLAETNTQITELYALSQER